MNVADERLRYPIGRWQAPSSEPDAVQRKAWIDAIAAAPAQLRAALEGLSEDQLDTPYRPGGWTVRQTAHHFADSHVNAYCRFRLAVTEDNPTIRPYDEKAWAELPDAEQSPVEPSLALIEALHDRWARLLRSLSDAEFQRPLHHPEDGDMTVWRLLSVYAWHGRHHARHITALRERMGW